MPRSPHLRFVMALVVTALVAVVGTRAFAGQPANAAASRPSPVAAGDTGGPRWAELSAAHRRVLAPLAPDWNGMDSRSKERWLDVAARFPKMPPDERQRANERMGEWAHMTVAQRQRARMNFQEMRSVSKEEREARWKAYQALPDEKKRELAKRAAAPARAAASTAPVRRHVPPPLDTLQPKNNVVRPVAPARTAAGSAPTPGAAHPGVTTTLLNHRATPPAHQRDGQPKIAAGPNSVDRTTLLPKRTAPTPAAPASAAAAAQRR